MVMMFCLCINTSAQIISHLLESDIHKTDTTLADTLKNICVLLDENNDLTIEEVRKKADTSWSDMDTLYKKHNRQFPFHSMHAFWWHIILENKTETVEDWVAEMDHRHVYEIYIVNKKDSITLRTQTGEWVNYSERNYPYVKNAFQFKLLPEQQTHLYIKHIRYTGYKGYWAVIKTAERKDKEISKRNTLFDFRFQFAFIFTGFFLSVFALVQFLLYKDKAYLYYGLYLLIGTLYFTYRYELDFGYCFIFGDIIKYYILFEPLLTYGLLLLYGLFGQAFAALEGKSKKMMDNLVKWLKYAILFAVIIHILSAIFFEYNTVYYVNHQMKRLIGIIPLILLFIVYKGGTRLSYIFFIGSAFLVFTTLIIFFTGLIRAAFFPDFQYNSYDILRIVTLIEYFFFAIALGYKTKLIQDDKNRIERELVDTEIKALKAQLNPHFIFNCLTSIKSLIRKNENDKADQYLQYFAKLIRATLNYSEKESITLEKELKIADLYVKMEALRFNHSFEFQIITDEAVYLENIFVPPVVLQPYLENAIHHGLHPKKGQKELKVEVYPEKEHIICAIDDTGIGRQQATKRKAERLNKTASFGMKLTKNRIEQYNKQLGENALALKIIDKADENGQATGTRIEIMFMTK